MALFSPCMCYVSSLEVVHSFLNDFLLLCFLALFLVPMASGYFSLLGVTCYILIG